MSKNSVLNQDQSNSTVDLSTNHELNDVYESGNFKLMKVKLLSKGGFGTCYIYKDVNTNVEYCLKALPKSNSAYDHEYKSRLEKEIEIHSKLHERSIVKVYHRFEDERYYYMVLELVDRSSPLEGMPRLRNSLIVNHKELRFNFGTAEQIFEMMSKKIIKELKLLIETPENAINQQPEINTEFPIFLTKLLIRRDLPITFHMSTGIIGYIYPNGFIVLTRPDTSTLLTYEKPTEHSHQYVGKHHTYTHFTERWPDIIEHIQTCSKLLQDTDPLYKTDDTPKYYSFMVEDISNSTFLHRFKHHEKFTIATLNDQTLQLILPDKSSVILGDKFQLITFIQGKEIFTFTIRDFFTAALLSGATVRRTTLGKSISCNQLNTSKLPKVDMDMFKNLNLEALFNKFLLFYEYMCWCYDTKKK